VNNNDESDRVPPTSLDLWVTLDRIEWMSFKEATDYARDWANGKADDEAAIGTIIARGNDGLFVTTASRTEILLEIEGDPPTRRAFDDWDAKRFSEMLNATYHGSPCPAIQEAETLTLCQADFVAGDFKFQVECSNPPYSVFLFVWGMAYRRADIEACFSQTIRPINVRTEGGEVPSNRTLDHNKIIAIAKAMRDDHSGISKGSAAASIVADLPRNPKTGKPRDTRHIERMIAHLWEGGLPQSPP
jgi:hypothetical protein